MKSWLSIPTMLTMVVVLGAATTDRFPPEVAADVKQMGDACRGNDGKPGPSGTYEQFGDQFKFHPRKLVEHGILGGTGVEVWAIDSGRFRCDGAQSMFSGSGGAQVSVFARLSDGQVRQVLMHGAYGMNVTGSRSSLKLWLRVGGPLCGQAGQPSHAESILCDRPMVWDATAQKMDFAPIAEARFPFGKPNQ